MRLKSLLGALVLLAFPSSAAHAEPGTDDYPRRIGIDVEHYRFELTLTDATDRIRGRTTVVIRFTASGVTELALRIGGSKGLSRQEAG